MGRDIENTSAGGVLAFSIFGALAKFEREPIRERTDAGRKAARKRGSPDGRRPVIIPDRLQRSGNPIASGLTVREAATRLEVGKTALHKALDSANPHAK